MGSIHKLFHVDADACSVDVMTTRDPVSEQRGATGIWLHENQHDSDRERRYRRGLCHEDSIMQTPTSTIDPAHLQAAANRLRRQRWPEHEGWRHGREWALQVAHLDDLHWWVQSADDVNLLQRLGEDKADFCEDWLDDIQGAGLDPLRFWRGFGAGVTAVWELVSAEVESEPAV